MSEHKTIKGYLYTVGEQIRWKRARASVLLELEQHLSDQRDAFTDEGYDDAERMAVEEMGDPVVLGTQLDGIHRPKPQKGLLILTILFAVVCAFLRVWLTAEWDYCYLAINPLKTALSVCLGCVALLGGYFLDYSFLARHGKKLYVGALIFGVLVLYCSPKVNNVSYYTRYAASCFPVVYAAWFYTCRNKGWLGILSAVAGGIPLCLICLAAPSIWGTLLLVIVGFVLFVMAAQKDWFSVGKGKTALVVTAGGISLAAAVCGTVLTSHSFLIRWENFLHPERDPLGHGYTAMMVKNVLSGSQWLGEGQLNSEFGSLSVEELLPNCETDLLLTTLIYKLGWIPFILLVAVFAGLLCWLTVRCIRQRSQFGKMIALSILIPFSLRTIMGIALSLGHILTSVSFPFFIGNLQMILDMGMVGLVLSVFRQDGIAQNTECVLRKKLHFQLVDSKGLL
ncbi:MAG: FtsW/RodA/SpoVE family cell cycle protein, partial [Oscillospiraceae bacterium]|nr:FtsW/RodA/SpoVE family cell cycle protein [Oscillospiraceae bacterium]